jgi:hypothetical protein
MANIQVIPIDVGDAGIEDIVIANAAVQVMPKDSVWTLNNGDLTVGSTVPARSGSWISRFNLLDIDAPPLVQWKFNAQANDQAEVVIENVASKAYLRVCNIDIKPDPKTLYPDTYWEVNGLDLIPRGV